MLSFMARQKITIISIDRYNEYIHFFPDFLFIHKVIFFPQKKRSSVEYIVLFIIST